MRVILMEWCVDRGNYCSKKLLSFLSRRILIRAILRLGIQPPFVSSDGGEENWKMKSVQTFVVVVCRKWRL